ncbi:MAG: hypothetical protein K0R05_4145 [Anaerocolumna sp.]|nr:hypothetical protein [Anaerocolumna sp.]
MFAIGEIKSEVNKRKVTLPKEYRLKKKNILGKWKDKSTLYLSESKGALNFAAGIGGAVFEADIGNSEQLQLPPEYDKATVQIRGCISTIELIFKQEKGEE